MGQVPMYSWAAGSRGTTVAYQQDTGRLVQLMTPRRGRAMKRALRQHIASLHTTITAGSGTGSLLVSAGPTCSKQVEEQRHDDRQVAEEEEGAAEPSSFRLLSWQKAASGDQDLEPQEGPEAGHEEPPIIIGGLDLREVLRHSAAAATPVRHSQHAATIGAARAGRKLLASRSGAKADRSQALRGRGGRFCASLPADRHARRGAFCSDS